MYFLNYLFDIKFFTIYNTIIALYKNNAIFK